MKKLILLFTLSLLACGPSQADNKVEIQAVNKAVAEIEKSKVDLGILELKVHAAELEGVPPEVKYYYKPGSMELIMMQVDVGHEAFSTYFTYYFKNNKIIKFIKGTENHPEKPPKQAIIYGSDGKVLWKNIDEPRVLTNVVVDLYKRNMALLKEFRKY